MAMFRLLPLVLIMVGAGPLTAAAQGTAADYERALGLRKQYEGLVVDAPETAHWIGVTDRFWYRRAVKGGHDFILVDAAARTKGPAFDHATLAASLSKAIGKSYTAIDLPFGSFEFVVPGTIQFAAEGSTWRCTLADYACRKTTGAEDAEAEAGRGRGGRGGGTGARGGRGGGAPEAERAIRSPDGKWEAVIWNFNVAVRPARDPGQTTATDRDSRRDVLSTDGSEGDPYELSSIAWSPDSSKLAAERVRPGYKREVHYVESSPADQIQPKYSSRVYAKPGDVLDLPQPVLFDVAAKKEIVVDNTLFPNPYDLTRLVWRKDGRAFTFEYNQRGHQVYRVIEVDATTGRARAVVSEAPKTFFNYRTANGSQSDSGKKYRDDVADGQEVIWMSERDGWNHLYLYDGVTGTVKNQITKGPWVVRAVQKVDEVKRQIWFSAGGMDPGQDPYFVHYYRIGFDGTGLTPLTPADANHTVEYSDDMKYFVDTWARVDMAPVSELHRADDGSLVMALEKGDLTALAAAGWKPPEVFVAKGRDGKTDIWGVIYRPTSFDPSKKYPVIENIYAGPQGSFVPKSFSPYNGMQSIAELGFIVVQIDGMGTSNRSKAFQDVAWKNLGDAGFADRILWHKAVAAKYPSYDITRVGIYGTSAGGQSSLGGLLFHPEFYKVAVSASGCHDNRMDKIWWNEQWMGWPIGPEYAASSNVDNAWRLQGDVLLIMGEMDTNVDPSSTLQVVNQLIKHDKNFDLLVIPGSNHTSGGPFGEHKRYDFFVQHLLGVIPPSWNALAAAQATTAAPGQEGLTHTSSSAADERLTDDEDEAGPAGEEADAWLSPRVGGGL
ncbi:MAG TPA: prolyl oligopeptidase family serine peptidase [Vicinamibacterales bacterium]|nr:prolyl oligopeptidase family serine peptidase [Vicinamibacterales bacterium]